MSNTARFLAGLLLFSLAGCYNTNNLKNGGLVCGKESACPEGYACQSDGHCWKKGTGTDAGATGTACTVAKAPYGPFASCTVNVNTGSTCDPVCQAGCPCNHRCVLDSTNFSDFACESATPTGSTFVQPLGSCTLDSVDPCAPGSLCIPDDQCASLCYKTCRQNSDCPTNSRCTRTGLLDANSAPVSNVYFCSPPIEDCNPTGTAACLTARANFNCVFLAGLTGVGNTDATTCDCVSLHTASVGSDCTAVPDSCVPGAACVDGTCRRLCNQKGTGSPCPTSSGGCTAIYGSTRYGYCR